MSTTTCSTSRTVPVLVAGAISAARAMLPDNAVSAVVAALRRRNWRRLTPDMADSLGSGTRVQMSLGSGERPAVSW